MSPELFRARRERVLEQVGNGVVLLGSAPELFRSRDTEVPYRQNSDLYYLTGVEEPEAVAVLTPHDPSHRFTLFVRPRDAERERWNGPRLGVEATKDAYGPDAVYPIDGLEEMIVTLLTPADRIVYSVGVHPPLDSRVLELVGKARRSRPRAGLGPTGIVDLDSVVGELRKVKDDAEVERMRTVAAIGAEGHLAAMAATRPGVGEWEVEAALEATFRRHGALGPAFPSIVGSGANATYLHYTTNSRRIEEGELVLVDAGADWGMYCSDITRTFPASGKFSKTQRELYDVVLAAHDAGIAIARNGEPITAIHEAAVRALCEGMVRLGILTGDAAADPLESGSYRRFYMHQTSHWLGLDVHDVGLYRFSGAPVTLHPGMVLTVEPGIYIPSDADDVPDRFRGLGIRIEDNIVVTDREAEILTGAVPVQAEEVERLVGAG